MILNDIIVDPPAVRPVTGSNSGCANAKPYALRWHKSDLNSYYSYTGSLLSALYLCPNHYNEHCTCLYPSACIDHKTAIDNMYNSIVDNLLKAESV